ncbi:SGNH hydrolase [Alternaria alternata]|uniref:SGNH hydrolase n=1 Tax=Alternaria alternata TaxID=5599 RepID=A0A177D5F2_ALTAL|nr:SGNH hydrolase [Alternaria alternata]OAG14738.1 SGNH hydrolase [Alternaria alternata]
MVSLKCLSAIALLAIASAQSTNNTTPIRYMPFGDSITEIVCWRSKLWQRLRTTEWANVNFVGSGKTENNCRDTTYDRDNEGHSGFLAIDIANKNQLDGWLKTNPADVITMHLGTNDIVQQNKAVTDIIAAFTKLIGTMRTSNPKMKIIVAQIIPLGIGNYNGKVQELNRAIVPWAQGLNTTQSPIWVVDQYTGFSGSADLRDGVHPNDSGDVKMANVWYPAVVRAFEAARTDRVVVGREFAA